MTHMSIAYLFWLQHQPYAEALHRAVFPLLSSVNDSWKFVQVIIEHISVCTAQ